MDRQQFNQSFGLSVDLAVEAHELLRGATRREIPGVREDREEHEFATVTTITILDNTGEKAMGKPKGTYITIESPQLWQGVPENQRPLVDLLAQKITWLVNQTGLLPQADILIVGLGNWQATPDSLGPKTIEQLLVTRHLHLYAPQTISPKLRSVSAIAPGVLGITGIETAEIIKGVVDHVHPGLVIAIDALAAQGVQRLGTTIQLGNTGISPGSGIGNTRGGLSLQTLGRPVLAIGVPTVVQAPALAYELLNRLGGDFQAKGNAPGNPVEKTVQELLAPFGGQLTVTPKEIDTVIEHVSDTLAEALNHALFPDLSDEEFAYFT